MKDFQIPRRHLMKLAFTRLSDTVSIEELTAWLEYETGQKYTIISTDLLERLTSKS